MGTGADKSSRPPPLGAAIAAEPDGMEAVFGEPGTSRRARARLMRPCPQSCRGPRGRRARRWRIGCRCRRSTRLRGRGARRVAGGLDERLRQALELFVVVQRLDRRADLQAVGEVAGVAGLERRQSGLDDVGPADQRVKLVARASLTTRNRTGGTCSGSATCGQPCRSRYRWRPTRARGGRR